MRSIAPKQMPRVVTFAIRLGERVRKLSEFDSPPGDVRRVRQRVYGDVIADLGGETTPSRGRLETGENLG